MRRHTIFLGVLAAACNVDTGDLTVSVVKSWQAAQDPFIEAESVRVRVDGPDLRAGPVTFKVKDRRGTLSDVPVGDDRQITVEGLGYEGNPVSRGRSGPLTIREGDNQISLFVGRIEDTGTFSYTPVRQLLVGRAFHTATLLTDGSVLICGGVAQPWRPEGDAQDTPPPTATMERIDGDSLEVRLASPKTCTTGVSRCMVSARFGHTATLLASGNVLVAGGSDESNLVGRAELYSPEDDRFVQAAAMTSPRAGHRAVPSDDGVVLVGGAAKGGLDLPGELFSSGQFQTQPGLLEGRRAFTLTRLKDGTLVAAGGVDRDDNVLSSIELLARGSPAWKRAPVGMKVPRAHHTATLEPEGTILFIGGLPAVDRDENATTTIERFDPAKGTIETLSAPLANARWAHTATLINDGRVLVVGGFSGNRNGAPAYAVEQISFFEGGVMEVRSLANLREARAGHTATLLGSGMLLVVGGVTVSGVSQTAEVFVY